MHIRDEKCLIRPAVAADAPQLCRWWNDGVVMEHAGFPDGLGIKEAAVVSQIASNAEGEHELLIIEVGGVPVGEMNYRTAAPGTAEIGIKLCDTLYQEKGIGTQCLAMMRDWLLAPGRFTRIVLDTNLKNERAQHVYETKLGFRRLGVRKKAWKDQRGEWQDAVDYEYP